MRAYDPEASDTARRLFGDRVTLCEKSYDALDGADALAIVTEWNEFREPDFKRMQAAAARRRSFSTAGTSTRPSTCARSASPTSPLAAEPRRRAGHRRRRLHRQPRLQGAERAAAIESSSSTTSCAGHREAVRYGELVEGDITDTGAVRAALRRYGIQAVMHFAAFLDVGESVREPVALLPQQRRRRAERSRGDGGRIGHASSSSRPPARPTASRSKRRSPKPIRSSRSTATARPSSRSSGRCRTSSARTACAGWRCVTSTPPAPIPTARSARITHPEIHLIPRAIDGGARRGAAAGVRRRLPDARRHLPARLHPRHRSGRRARQGARGARRDGALRRLQSRHRPASLGARGDRQRRARHRPPGVRGRWARAGPAIRPCSMRRRRRRRPSCTGSRAFPISMRSCARPGTGTVPIRTAIGQRPLIRERTQPAPPPVPLRDAVSRADRLGGRRDAGVRAPARPGWPG